MATEKITITEKLRLDIIERRKKKGFPVMSCPSVSETVILNSGYRISSAEKPRK